MARDMAKLDIILRQKYPQHFHYFGQSTMKFNGNKIRGHNRVLSQLKGAEGIKTGYKRFHLFMRHILRLERSSGIRLA